MTSKKILLISHSPLLSGGAELSLLEIATYLHNHGANIKIILPAKGAFSKRLDELHIANQVASYRWSVTYRGDKSMTHDDIGIFNADSTIEAYKIISSFRPDVVMTNTIVVPWFGYAAKALGISHVLLISELYDDSSNLKFLPNDNVYLDQLKYTTDFIIYNSNFTASTYTGVFAGIDSIVAYPTVKIDNDNLNLVKKSFKKAHDPLRLIIYGSIARHKNQKEALEALSILLKKGINATLTILGPIGVKEYYSELRSTIKKLGIHDFVTFLPFQENPFNTIHQHDIVLVPSLSETFGRVTAEAQLLGRIVVGANVSATAELIDDGHTGFLYRLGSAEDLAEKIKKVVDDPVAARVIAREAQRTAVKQFLDKDHNASIEDLLFGFNHPIEINDTNFNLLNVLLRRNIYTNEKIQEYASALNDSIKVNQNLNKYIGPKSKQALRKLLAIINFR